MSLPRFHTNPEVTYKKFYLFFPDVQLFLSTHQNFEVDEYIQPPSDMEEFSDSEVHQDSEIEIYIDEESQVNTQLT